MLHEYYRCIFFLSFDSVHHEDVAIFGGHHVLFKLESVLLNDLLDIVLSVINISFLEVVGL